MTQRRSLGHRQRAGSRAAGHGQELLGIARRADPRCEDRVIGSELALDAKARRGEPRERIEPVESARCVGDELREGVATANVS